MYSEKIIIIMYIESKELQEMLTFFSNSCNSFFVFASFSLSLAKSVSLSFSLACSSFLLFLETEKINNNKQQ